MILSDAYDYFTQVDKSGGIHTHPAFRILLYALAKSINAQFIVETGYDAGVTTEALAMTGAYVAAIDNWSEYSDVKVLAKERLENYPNVQLEMVDALEFLARLGNNKVDFIFFDDYHGFNHVEDECREVRRILRPGGIAAFHDTDYCKIWGVLETEFPDWQKINISDDYRNTSYGLGIVIKPID